MKKPGRVGRAARTESIGVCQWPARLDLAGRLGLANLGRAAALRARAL